MGAGAALVGKAGVRIDGGVGVDLRRGSERRQRHRLLDRRDRQRNRERRRRRAGALAAAAAAELCPGPGAQAVLGRQVAGAGQQSHLDQAPAVHQAGLDQLLAVLEGVVHLLEPRPRDALPLAVVVRGILLLCRSVPATHRCFAVHDRDRSSDLRGSVGLGKGCIMWRRNPVSRLILKGSLVFSSAIPRLSAQSSQTDCLTVGSAALCRPK